MDDPQFIHGNFVERAQKWLRHYVDDDLQFRQLLKGLDAKATGYVNAAGLYNGDGSGGTKAMFQCGTMPSALQIIFSGPDVEGKLQRLQSYFEKELGYEVDRRVAGSRTLSASRGAAVVSFDWTSYSRYEPWAMTWNRFISVLPDRVSDIDGYITVESVGPVWEGDASFVWITIGRHGDRYLRSQRSVLPLTDV